LHRAAAPSAPRRQAAALPLKPIPTQARLGGIHPHDLSTGLVAWWQAEGNANDSVGTANGTLSNVTFTTCETGQAFGFNGSTSNADVGSGAWNFGTSAFTIQFWLRDTANTGQGILGKRSVCEHANMWDIRGGSGGLTLELDQDSSGTNYVVLSIAAPIGDGK